MGKAKFAEEHLRRRMAQGLGTLLREEQQAEGLAQGWLERAHKRATNIHTHTQTNTHIGKQTYAHKYAHAHTHTHTHLSCWGFEAEAHAGGEGQPQEGQRAAAADAWRLECVCASRRHNGVRIKPLQALAKLAKCSI